MSIGYFKFNGVFPKFVMGNQNSLTSANLTKINDL